MIEKLGEENFLNQNGRRNRIISENFRHHHYRHH